MTPFELPGEDRTFGGDVLFVDLIPRTVWWSNVRAMMSPSAWSKLSLAVRSRVDRCEACGTIAPPRERDAHERWAFNSETGEQSLRRLVALCKPCHEVTHFGLAMIRGFSDRAFEHLARVRQWDDRITQMHIDAAFHLFSERSRRSWKTTATILEDAGYPLLPPPPQSKS